MLSQCFSYYCCMESLGKLPPKRFGHHMVNVSAILRILFWGCQSRGVNLGRGGQRLFRTPRDRRRQHTGRAATPATGLCRLFPVLSSLWRVCRNPLLLLPGPPNLCADAASRNQRQRSGDGQRRAKPARRGKAATADNRPPAKFTGEKDQGGFGSAVAPDSLPSSSKIMDSVMSNFSRTNREVHAHSEERDESNPRQPVKHIRQAPRRVAKQTGIPREGDGTYSRHHEQPGSDCGRTGGDDCAVVQLVLQRALCEPPRRLCGAAHKPAHSSPCIDEVGFVRPDRPEVQPE